LGWGLTNLTDYFSHDLSEGKTAVFSVSLLANQTMVWRLGLDTPGAMKIDFFDSEVRSRIEQHTGEYAAREILGLDKCDVNVPQLISRLVGEVRFSAGTFLPGKPVENDTLPVKSP